MLNVSCPFLVGTCFPAATPIAIFPSCTHHFLAILSHLWVPEDTVLSQLVTFHSLVLFLAIIVFLYHLCFRAQHKYSHMVLHLSFFLNFVKFSFLKSLNYQGKVNYCFFCIIIVSCNNI